MITVTITLSPRNGGERRELYRATISNDGTGTEAEGNYNAVVRGPGDEVTQVRIERFRRAMPNGAAKLVEAVLRKALPFVPENKYSKLPRRAMTNEERDQLIAAHKALTAMLLATIDGKNDRCGCFHIEPFKTHWDRSTVEEVMASVKLYLRSWVYTPMTQALGQEDILKEIA